MKYSIIIGLSDECCDTERLSFVVSTIDNAFTKHGYFSDNFYEIIVPFMTKGEEQTLILPNMIPEDNFILVPWPINGYFSNSIQYNFGIRAAKGTYIIQTDTDVGWREDLITNVERILFNDPDAFIGCDFKFLKEEYSRYDHEVFDAITKGMVPEGWIKTLLADSQAGWFYGNLQIYPKKIFEEAQGYDERMRCWGEWDNDWNLRARSRLKAYALPQWSMYHLFHEPRKMDRPPDYDFNKLQQQLHSFGRMDRRFVKNDENWGTSESKYFLHPHYEEYPE